MACDRPQVRALGCAFPACGRPPPVLGHETPPRQGDRPGEPTPPPPGQVSKSKLQREGSWPGRCNQW